MIECVYRLAQVSPCVEELDMFAISAAGLSTLELSRTCFNPCTLVEYRLHDPSENKQHDINQFPVFELILELSRAGWTYCQQSKSKKTPPYTQGSSKQWFFHKAIDKRYLRILLQSESMFAAGLRQIYHFQGSGYYSALLSVKSDGQKMNTIKPWQPLAYYKLFLQNRKQKASCLAPDPDMDTEQGK